MGISVTQTWVLSWTPSHSLTVYSFLIDDYLSMEVKILSNDIVWTLYDQNLLLGFDYCSLSGQNNKFFHHGYRRSLNFIPWLKLRFRDLSSSLSGFKPFSVTRSSHPSIFHIFCTSLMVVTTWSARTLSSMNP